MNSLLCILGVFVGATLITIGILLPVPGEESEN